jgi:hypothetical protein
VIVITDQSSKQGFDLVSSLDPLMNVAQDLSLLDVEMTQDYCFKSLRGFLDLAEHRPFDVTVPDDVHVTFITFLTIDGTSFVLKSRLVEVDFLRHDNSLS